MAYMNQETKTRIAQKLKPILKEFGVKGTLSVRNHSVLVLKLRSGAVDFDADYTGDTTYGRNTDVNVYHYRNHYQGRSREFLNQALVVMNDGNWDQSDIQTDYFDVGWYTDIKIGEWNKPYQVAA